MKRYLLIILCLLPLLRARSEDTTGIQPDIIHTRWFCSHENIYRRVDIYLPAAYNDSIVHAQSSNPQSPDRQSSNRQFPVLYLLHGINGYEGSWLDKGHVIDTLERMMADGRCQPLIVVMPDVNKWPFKERPKHGNLWKCLTRYNRLSHEHEIEHSISELMDFMDTTYQVSSYCAIAGLSDGARIAANVAQIRPECIAAVGLFSPVLHREQVPQRLTDVQYYVYGGKKDIFYPYAKRLHKRLNKAGYPHQFIELDGNHNWRMWRLCLSDFLERTF